MENTAAVCTGAERQYMISWSQQRRIWCLFKIWGGRGRKWLAPVVIFKRGGSSGLREMGSRWLVSTHPVRAKAKDQLPGDTSSVTKHVVGSLVTKIRILALQEINFTDNGDFSFSQYYNSVIIWMQADQSQPTLHKKFMNEKGPKTAKNIHPIKNLWKHPLTNNAFLAVMCSGPLGPQIVQSVLRKNRTGLLFKYLNELLHPSVVTGHIVLWWY